MNKDSEIPVIVVTGFLGSGKTTFIKRILEKFSDQRKIGIIQNEYAMANIDSAELKALDQPFEILEIIGGTIFCICLIANFLDSLSAFIDEVNPEIIIIEASGLSDPIAIAELFQYEKLAGKLYLSHIWCIIDSVNYLKTRKMMNRIQHQVMISDTLIINKTDIGKENVPAIREELTSLNQEAIILEASYCNVDIDDSAELMTDETIALRWAKQHAGIMPAGRPEIFTVVLKTTRPISKDGLNRFLAEVQGKLIRLKGFVMLNDNQRVKIQSGFGTTTVEEISWYSGPTELIGLGYDITPAGFGRRFHEIRQFYNLED